MIAPMLATLIGADIHGHRSTGLWQPPMPITDLQIRNITKIAPAATERLIC